MQEHLALETLTPVVGKTCVSCKIGDLFCGFVNLPPLWRLFSKALRFRSCRAESGRSVYTLQVLTVFFVSRHVGISICHWQSARQDKRKKKEKRRKRRALMNGPRLSSRHLKPMLTVSANQPCVRPLRSMTLRSFAIIVRRLRLGLTLSLFSFVSHPASNRTCFRYLSLNDGRRCPRAYCYKLLSLIARSPCIVRSRSSRLGVSPRLGCA